MVKPENQKNGLQKVFHQNNYYKLVMNEDTQLGHWICDISVPEEFFGFIYLITNRC